MSMMKVRKPEVPSLRRAIRLKQRAEELEEQIEQLPDDSEKKDELIYELDHIAGRLHKFQVKERLKGEDDIGSSLFEGGS